MSLQDLLYKKTHKSSIIIISCGTLFLASVVVEPRRSVVWQKGRSGNPANAHSSSSRSCKVNNSSEEGEDDGVVGRTQEDDKKKLSCCCYAGGDGWCEEEEEEGTQIAEQQQNVEEFAQDYDDYDDAWDVVVEDEDVQLLAKFRTMSVLILIVVNSREKQRHSDTVTDRERHTHREQCW
ncbi:unnamed protein product [Sphagnum troendelagicum]|jgi:hypothetical protein